MAYIKRYRPSEVPAFVRGCFNALRVAIAVFVVAISIPFLVTWMIASAYMQLIDRFAEWLGKRINSFESRFKRPRR